MITKDKYIQLKNNHQVDFEDLFDFYQKADHEKPKIDWNTFQQTLPHYLQNGGNLDQYIRNRDSLFEIMYLKQEGHRDLIV